VYIYLDIVENFVCEMCGCCCRNDWLVTLDEDSYHRNAQLFLKTGRSEEFSEIFIPLIDKSGLGEFACIAKKTSGGCWFLAENNHCQLQKEAGHSHLDNVCQTFPRYPMNTARGTELTLSFSCPAVIRLANRTAPLTIIRSEESPIVFNPNNDVVFVYPQQQPIGDPLRHYFELEQHFIDIMQCRCISIGERLQMINETALAIGYLPRDHSMGQQLNKIFYDNYELLDNKVASSEQTNLYLPEILLENFFVNFIFKKPFYIYGLLRTIELLESIWLRMENTRKVAINSALDMECTQTIIMEVEFEYSHNRGALFAHTEKQV